MCLRYIHQKAYAFRCQEFAGASRMEDLLDKFARINHIDQSIFESEREMADGAEAIDAEIVFAELEKKAVVSPRT